MIINQSNIQIEIECSKVRNSYGSQKNLVMACCTSCGILFETIKFYKQKECSLCRYEKGSEEFKKLCGDFNDLEKKVFAKHRALKRKKENTMKASGCIITNSVTVKRDIAKFDSPLHYK